MKFHVEMTAQAGRDLDEILSWIAKRSPQGAATWHQRWLEVLNYLESSADKASLAPEDADHDQAIRNVVFKTRRGRRYRIILTIQNEVVYALHIRGPGQNLLSAAELKLPPHLSK